MTEAIWVAIITAMASVISSILGYTYKHFQTMRQQKNRRSFSNILPAIHTVYGVISTLHSSTSASRVVIHKTENGGGKPRLGANLYASIIYEVFDRPMSAVKAYWQRQLIDEEYINILCRLVTSPEGMIEIKTEKMKQGILKDAYLSEGVAKSLVFSIAERENSFLYLSIKFATDNELSATERTLIRASVNQLRSMFSQYDEL